MFLKFHPKNTQIRHFWSQIYRFFFLHKTLKIDKFKTVDSKMTIIFLNSSPKIPDIRQFWSQFKRNLFLRQTLEFNKFDAAVFKYGKRFSKLLNKTTKQGILSPNTYLPQVFIFFFLFFSFSLFLLLCMICQKHVFLEKMQSHWGFIYCRKLLLAFGNLILTSVNTKIFVKKHDKGMEQETCFKKNDFPSIIN